MKSKKYTIEICGDMAFSELPDYMNKLFLQGYRAGREQAREETAKTIRSKVLGMLDGEKNMLARLNYAAIIVWIENVFNLEPCEDE